jgi:PAS domain S-box-containing protein
MAGASGGDTEPAALPAVFQEIEMKRDQNKTKDELMSELTTLRLRVAELENDKVERKLVEEALEESEERFRVIFNNLRDGLLLADKETKEFLMGNPAIYNMLGYTPEELNCLGIDDIHPEHDLPYVIDQFEKLARREISIAPDIPVKRKDGTVFYADISASFSIVFARKESVMGVFRDITERRQTEEALRQSEARYRNIFENAAEGIYQSAPDGRRYMEVNPAFARMFGYDSPEVMKHAVEDIGNQLYVDPTIREECIRTLQKQDTAVFEVQFRKRDGSMGWLSNNVRAVRDHHGKITHFEGVAEDITEHKRMEEALRESEERYRRLVELSPETVAVHVDGRLAYINPAGAELLGAANSEELVGKLVRDFMFPDSRETVKTEIQEDIEIASTSPLLEQRILRLDGKLIDVEVTEMPVDYRNKAAVQVLIRDITDRRRAENELRRAHNELEDRVGARTAELQMVNDQLRLEIAEHKRTQEALKLSENQLRFLSSRLLEAQEEERKRIARELHDSIGQSLAAIKFNVESLLQREAIRNSEELAKPLAFLVPIIQGAIEEARRIYTGLRPSILDDLGILATFSWFCREFRRTFPHIRICEEIGVREDEIPEPIKIVLFRVLQEALNNIAKYSHAGRVSVSLLKVSNNIELTIEDNGKGFDWQEVISTDAFDKGLGLTGMWERTHFSGGTFQIESQIGRGTTIQALWPSPA